jgi:hypothetical protein
MLSPTAAVIYSPAGVAYVHPHLSLHSFVLTLTFTPAFGHTCPCLVVLFCAGPCYLVTLVWPLFVLICAHLGSPASYLCLYQIYN